MCFGVDTSVRMALSACPLDKVHYGTFGKLKNKGNKFLFLSFNAKLLLIKVYSATFTTSGSYPYFLLLDGFHPSGVDG